MQVSYSCILVYVSRASADEELLMDTIPFLSRTGISIYPGTEMELLVLFLQNELCLHTRPIKRAVQK